MGDVNDQLRGRRKATIHHVEYSYPFIFNQGYNHRVHWDIRVLIL